MGTNRMWMVLLLVVVGVVRAQQPLPPVNRLPSSVTPLSLVVRLEPDLTTNLITGSVHFTINTTDDRSVTLNSITLSMGLDVLVSEKEVLLLDSNGVAVNIGSVQSDSDNSLLKILLYDEATLKYGHVYFLSIKFTSKLYTEPKGLFVGSYNSTSKYIASSLRATHARDVFPCFDEPQYQIPVTLIVLRPANYIANSTGKLQSSSNPDADGLVADTFKEVTCSIHTLGLLIYPAVNPTSIEGVTVYAPPSLKPAPYIASLVDSIVASLGHLPGNPVLAVLPDRIYTTASSNGFVFVSPEVFTGEVGTVSKLSLLKVRLTEHLLRQYLEYQHTPAWWSDIWLSDSVGAFLATSFQTESEPWLTEYLKTEIRSKALGADFTNSTGPVVNPQLLNRYDIENVLSNQTIKFKGLSVLVMWNDTMPEGLVKETILDFIKDSSKTLVMTSDFLEVMIANINKDTKYNVTEVIPLLPYWLNTTGYPVLSYWPLSSSDVILTQSPGCPSADPLAAVSPLWPLSISLSQNSSDWTQYRQDLWSLSTMDNVTSYINTSDWVIFNLEAAPFRVHYTASWAQILAALPGVLAQDAPDSVRAALQDDVMALALGGCVPWLTALTVLNTTQRGQLDWYPLTKAFTVISSLITEDSWAFNEFALYVETIFTPALLPAFALVNGSASLEYPRQQLTPWLCRLNLGDCRSSSVQLFNNLLLGNDSLIDPHDVENVACYGALYNVSAFDSILEAYATTQDPWFKYLYTIGLSCIIDPSSVQVLLENTIYNVNSTSIFTTGDAETVLLGLARSFENSEVVVDFLVQHASDVQTRFGPGTLSNVIQTLSNHRADLSNLSSLTSEDMDLNPYVQQSATSALSKAKALAAWWQTQGPSLVSTFPQLPMTTTPTTNPTPTHSPVTVTTARPPTTAAPAAASSLLAYTSLLAAALMLLVSCV